VNASALFAARTVAFLTLNFFSLVLALLNSSKSFLSASLAAGTDSKVTMSPKYLYFADPHGELTA